MELIKATENELQELCSLYQRTAENMKQNGLNQWNWGLYPTEEMIRGDVERGEMYIAQAADGSLAAAVVLTETMDPAYAGVSWTGGVRPGMIHRLAIDPPLQGAGIGGDILDDAIRILRRAGCDCVRCDTNMENLRAVRLYEKMGFRICGTVFWDDTPEEKYFAFDKRLKRETPLWPILMKPAFRDGALTPWGGNRLREIYGKETKNDRTGESMEVSCIPGFESTDAQGRKLTELIAEHREKLVGSYADKPFPLLLKLIDVREKLSVQVHPNDAYAAEHENGKLGKTEAWLVLDTPAGGGDLVYGVKQGTTRDDLKAACDEGTVEKLLNKVKVKRGDVCFIPAGCVHAVGAGVMLYEIQQSSDLTYRFYDWDRADADGNKRELHLDKALDVARLRSAPAMKRVGKAFGTRRVLSEKYFTLDLIHTDTMELLPAVHEFGILTVIEGEMELRFSGGMVAMKAGDTCLLAKNGPELALVGAGTAALAMPG